MKFAESLRKEVMYSFVGCLINKLKLRRRRDVIFFGDIFNELIRVWNTKNPELLERIGKEWMSLYFISMVPSAMRKLPVNIFLNTVMKTIWHNLGLLDDLKAEHEGDIFTIRTRNENITNVIGNNHFLPGLYKGVLSVMLNSSVITESIKQTRDKRKYNVYKFRVSGKESEVEPREKEEYNKINNVNTMNDLTLPNAIKKKMITIEHDNRMYYNGHALSVVENTLFHILGEHSEFLEDVSGVSAEFFKKMLAKSGDDYLRIKLLKNVLQVMGWGIITVKLSEDEIIFTIKSPPYGLRKTGDNWKFISETILGYIHTFKRNAKIKKYEPLKGKVIIVYSLHQ